MRPPSLGGAERLEEADWIHVLSVRALQMPIGLMSCSLHPLGELIGPFAFNSAPAPLTCRRLFPAPFSLPFRLRLPLPFRPVNPSSVPPPLGAQRALIGRSRKRRRILRAQPAGARQPPGEGAEGGRRPPCRVWRWSRWTVPSGNDRTR